MYFKVYHAAIRGGASGWRERAMPITSHVARERRAGGDGNLEEGHRSGDANLLRCTGAHAKRPEES